MSEQQLAPHSTFLHASSSHLNICSRLLTAEPRFLSKDIHCGIWGEKSGNGVGCCAYLQFSPANHENRVCDWHLQTNKLTNELTSQPCGTVSFLKSNRHRVKKFPAFYGTRMFITAFARPPHLFLSWAIWVQSSPHPIPRYTVISTSVLPRPS